mgnify:CR=1 FL=1
MLFRSRGTLLAAAMPANVIISIIANDSPWPFALGPLPLSSFTKPHPPPVISESPPVLLVERLLLLSPILLIPNVVALIGLDCDDAFPAAS